VLEKRCPAAGTVGEACRLGDDLEGAGSSVSLWGKVLRIISVVIRLTVSS
jgi:hypothetical protein